MRKTETKTCTDCHLSEANDNNAIMAQLLLQGTNFVNFVGFNAWVGVDGGFEAVQVTEWDEPQAVIGSYLHRYAYPDLRYVGAPRERDWTREPAARERASIRSTRRRATALPAAARRIYLRRRGQRRLHAPTTSPASPTRASPSGSSPAPVSPLGPEPAHRVRATPPASALPTNQPIHPDRNQGDLMREDNQEQPFHPIYNYAVVTDGWRA